MLLPVQADCRNRLLTRLPAHDFDLLSPCLETVTLVKGNVLAGALGPVGHVVFPEAGIVSVVPQSPAGQQVEAGLFGRDGFGPISAVLGDDTTAQEVIVQVSGHGFSIDRATMTRMIEASPTLRGLLLRYVSVFTTQTTYTALSNAVHSLDERLARWILMVHDRTSSDDLALTHEFISAMLGVRRPSVTTSLHVLEGNGLIGAERGYVTVRDRRGLEDFARDAYGRPEAEYLRLIGSM